MFVCRLEDILRVYEERRFILMFLIFIENFIVVVYIFQCVCGCVCEREREREYM